MEGRILNPAAVLISLAAIFFIACLIKSLKRSGVFCIILAIVILIAVIAIIFLT